MVGGIRQRTGQRLAQLRDGREVRGCTGLAGFRVYWFLPLPPSAAIHFSSRYRLVSWVGSQLLWQAVLLRAVLGMVPAAWQPCCMISAAYL